MSLNGYDYELIMVDDGSTDGSWEIVKDLSEKNHNIRGISFRRNYGKSAALYHGFAAAKGRVVVTMDADLQDPPSLLPEMLDAMAMGGGAGRQNPAEKLRDRLIAKGFDAFIYESPLDKIKKVIGKTEAVDE